MRRRATFKSAVKARAALRAALYYAQKKRRANI